MRIILFTLQCFFLINCTHSQKQQTLGTNQKVEEPLMAFIPDSMKAWVPILKKVGDNDQKYRSINDPKLFKKNLAEQNKLDSENQIIVSKYLDKYGWPKMKMVGAFGKIAIFDVIQHAPLSMQEKYYPLLVKAVKEHSYNGD